MYNRSRQLSSLVVTRLGRSYQKPSTSYFSTITDDDDGLVLSQADEDSGVAILAMNRPPANSLNLQMYVAMLYGLIWLYMCVCVHMICAYDHMMCIYLLAVFVCNVVSNRITYLIS
jgi:hypothetical protein